MPLVKADQVQQVLIEKITKQVEQSEIPAIVGKQQQQIEDLKKRERPPGGRTGTIKTDAVRYLYVENCDGI